MRYSNRPIYQRRRRIALLSFVLLLLGLYVLGLGAGGTGGERLERVDAPTFEQAPEAIDEQTVTDEEETT